MQIPTEIEQLNKQLRDLFGLDTITGMTIWRIVWSDDQFENRYGTYIDFSEAGLYIREVTEVRYVPKYSWIQQKYILERLVLIPEINQQELPSSRLSYEVIWVFEDRNGFPLPPRLDACQFIINTVLAAQSVAKNLIIGNEKVDKQAMRKYIDPEETQEGAIQAKKERVDKLIDEIFGDELGMLGLRTGETIISPGSGNNN